MNKILVIGATSALAEATARLWAAEGHRLHLIGRDAERLAAIAADLKVRGAEAVTVERSDLLDHAGHAAAIDRAIASLDGLDIALIAHGSLGDQKACEADVGLALRELDTNAISVVSLLTLLGDRCAARQHGTIAVIGSVAGDRGRKSNYVYGAAKGLVGLFAEGMQHRFADSPVRLVLIKPGPTDTPMTAHLKTAGARLADPAKVAAAIHRAIGRGTPVAYVPGIWRPIMWLIRNLPRPLFNRLDI